MTQRERIVKAIKLLRPVALSVADRRPKGVLPYNADRICQTLGHALIDLEDALDYFDGMTEREHREASAAR